MSRIGKQPVLIPGGVTVEVSGQTVAVKGAKGECAYTAPDCIGVAVEDSNVVVSRTDESKHGKAMFGTVRSLIDNMIVGVSKGYRKELTIEGVGYKAQMKGQDLVLSLGFSHDINYNIPDSHGWYVTLSPTITANWSAPGRNQWTVPVGGGVGKVFKVGKQPMSAQIQAFGFPAKPDNGPEWGIQFMLKFLFPK